MAVPCAEGRKRCSSVAICGIWLAVLVGVHGDCPSPPRLEYGELTDASLTVTALPVSTNLIYQCRPGYIRMPGKTNSITCLATNAWSKIQEFCDRRDCGNPGELVNGEVALSIIPGTDLPDTKFGAIATFSCNEGYRLIGRNVRTCTAAGWNNAVPQCEVVICASPPSIANGVHTDSDKTEFQYQSAVLYSCKDATFTLLGNPVLSCTQYGNWSGPPPTCTGDCPSPPKLDYGELTDASRTVTAFPVGTNLIYQCRPGYIRTPGKTNSITCLATNAWSKIQEFCQRRDCGSPGELLNGEVALSIIPGTDLPDTKYGAIAIFSCNEGYKLQGRNVRRCTATGWNNAVPQCEDSQCPPRYLPLVKDLTLDTVFATSPKDICVAVSQSMSDNWDKMSLEDKYNHLQFLKLCLEMRL